jgi:hypothetical protein
MSLLDITYRKAADIVFRKVAGEFILVPIRHQAGDLECIYTLNEVAARAWELIDGLMATKQIAAVLYEEFEVDKSVLEKDLIELFGDLRKIEAVEPAEPDDEPRMPF